MSLNVKMSHLELILMLDVDSLATELQEGIGQTCVSEGVLSIT